MFEDISGKTALVTGASGGLGLHFAGVLARHGAKVLLAARRADALERACAQIRDAGGSAEPVLLDVADARSIAVALAGRDIDILVTDTAASPDLVARFEPIQPPDDVLMSICHFGTRLRNRSG